MNANAQERQLIDGAEYLYKTTDPWQWDGEQRWWEVTVEFDGHNGIGGRRCVERWRWNGSAEVMRTQPRSLTPTETEEIESKIRGMQ